MPKTKTSKKLRIFMVGTECAPFISAGGVGSVISYLSRSLSKLGHEVNVFIPKFGSMDIEKHPMEMFHEGLKIKTGNKVKPELICNVKKAITKGDVNYYFLENKEYFEQRANIYGYSDDHTRFLLLSKGLLEFIKTLKCKVDVIHANDWHTGYVPNLIKTEYADDKCIGVIPTLFTIHNLSYQGIMDFRNVKALDYDDGKSPIKDMLDDKVKFYNSMKRGIIYAEVVNTVSKTYAREILTSEFGEGLDRLLGEVQEKLYGVINGLDYDAFDPATDSRLTSNYDIDTIEDRAQNKPKLQSEFGLPNDPDALLIGYVGRLAPMKGMDLGISVLKKILKSYNVQFVQIGGGDSTVEKMLVQLRDEFPKQVGIHPSPNFTLPRLLFAGSDCIMYPSKFEPCGIVQIEALRYGSVPIVRNVGGLSDTIKDFDIVTGKGNGFVFNEYDEFELYGAIVRAIETFKHKESWRKLQINGMSSNYSWTSSAKEYVKLYYIAKEKKFSVESLDKAFEQTYG